MEDKIVSRSVRVTNRYGLHARPAYLFVDICQSFDCTVTVSRQGSHANGRSIIEILSLGAYCESEITITCSGPNAEEAITALVNLVEDNFGE